MPIYNRRSCAGISFAADGPLAPVGITFPLPITPGNLRIVSTDAADDAVGAGAREVEGTCVYEEIVDGLRYHRTVNFRAALSFSAGAGGTVPTADNGLPTGAPPGNPNAPQPQLLASSVIRVTNMAVRTTGSGVVVGSETRQVNAGEIKATIDGATVNLIRPHEGTAEFPHIYTASDLSTRLLRFSATATKPTGATAKCTVEPYLKLWKGAERRLQIGYMALITSSRPHADRAIPEGYALPQFCDFFLRIADTNSTPVISADMVAAVERIPNNDFRGIPLP